MKPIQHYINKAINNPEKVFRKIDKVMFGGYFRKMFDALEEKKQRKLEQFIAAHPEEYYDKQVNQMLKKCPVMGQQKYSVKDILFAQFQNGEAVFYDVVIGVLALEQYYAKRTDDFELFSQARKQSEGYSDFWNDRFIRLIESYEAKGLDDDAPIEVDENLILIDGACRLALALYHKEEFISVRVRQKLYSRKWNYNYLWELNLSKDSIKQVFEKAKELFNNSKYLYSGVIWPSSYHLRDEIVNEINNYMKSGQYPPLQSADCQLVRFVDYNLTDLDYEGFIRTMYYADGMTEWGIEHKKQITTDCFPAGTEEYPVRVIYVDVTNPDIGRNDGNNTARSMSITGIKHVVRNRFKDKIDHYDFDNVMHLNDNYIQSKFSDVAINFDKNVSDLFEILNKKYKYVIVKQEGRQSEEFPCSFYYHTDIDMVVDIADMDAMGRDVEMWLSNKYKNLYGDWVDVHIERFYDNDEQLKVVVTLRGFRYFMIHLQTAAHFGMNDKFNGELIANGVWTNKKLINILLPKYDMLVRVAELIHHPNREWHNRYIEKYINDYDENLVKRAYGENPDFLQKIKEIFTKAATKR